MKTVGRVVGQFALQDIALQKVVMNQATFNDMIESESLLNRYGIPVLNTVENQIGKMTDIGGYTVQVVTELGIDGTPLIPDNKVLFIGKHNEDKGDRIKQVNLELVPGVYGQNLIVDDSDKELLTEKTIHEAFVGFDILLADCYITATV